MSQERHCTLVSDSHVLSQQQLPLVSICIPAYNAEATLGETLESLLSQDYPHLDIVVSDNHSTDGTKAVVESFTERGVRYCTPPKRPEWASDLPSYVGAYINSAYVLTQGRADYLCLFHSDDLYDPSIVRRQVEMMQAYTHVGAVFTLLQTIGEDGRPINMGTSTLPKELRGRSRFDFSTLLNAVLTHSNFLATPSVMLRRSTLEHVGSFDERHFLTSADLEMWLRIAYQGYEIAVIDHPLLRYRISQRQFGTQYNKLRTTLADIFSVLDHYLSQPDVQMVVQPQLLALYRAQRASDSVLCAMHLLIQGKVVEARVLLQHAMHVRYFITALKHPRLLARLIVGMCFWVSIRLGLGALLGQLVYHSYQRDLQRRRQPLRQGK